MTFHIRLVARVIFYIGLFILMSSCAGSPARISMMDKNKLRDVKTYDLCRAYGNNMWRAYKVKDELIFRKRQNDLKRSINLVSELPPPEDWEWELIERKSIRVGMSECGLLASWGKPRKINGSSHGPSQWVYGNYGSYVYVQRREITAWQD